MQTQSVLTCCTAFSCEAGEFLEMSSQQCTSCAAGSYSLGSGVRFDQWDSIPAGFSSLATYMDSGGSGDDSMTCNKSVPSYILKYIYPYIQFSMILQIWIYLLTLCCLIAVLHGHLRELSWNPIVTTALCHWCMQCISWSRDPSPLTINMSTATSSSSSLCVLLHTSFRFFLKMCWSENISLKNMFYFWCRFRMTNVRRWTRQGVRNGSNSPLTESGEPIRLVTLFIFKVTVHSKLKIQSSFTPNLYDFLSSAEHHRRYFEEC